MEKMDLKMSGPSPDQQLSADNKCKVGSVTLHETWWMSNTIHYFRQAGTGPAQGVETGEIKRGLQGKNVEMMHFLRTGRR